MKWLDTVHQVQQPKSPPVNVCRVQFISENTTCTHKDAQSVAKVDIHFCTQQVNEDKGLWEMQCDSTVERVKECVNTWRGEDTEIPSLCRAAGWISQLGANKQPFSQIH